MPARQSRRSYGNNLPVFLQMCIRDSFEYQTGIKFPLMNIMVEPDADGVIPLESGLLV